MLKILFFDDKTEDEILELTEKEMAKIRLWASGEMDKILFTTETILAQESDLWKKDFFNFTASEMYLWREWASQEVINLTPEIKESIESLKQPINRLSSAMRWLIILPLLIGYGGGDIWASAIIGLTGGIIGGIGFGHFMWFFLDRRKKGIAS